MTGQPLTGSRLDAWRSAQPPGRRALLLPAGLWLLVIVLATVLSPEGGCTAASPCGPDWGGAVEVTLAVAAPVVLLWWSRLGVVLSLAAAALFVYAETTLEELPGWLSVGLPLAVVAATLEVERRRRAIAARAAGLVAATAVVPGPAPDLPRWTSGLLLGAVLVAASPVPVLYGVLHGRSVAAVERRAQHVDGTVVAHGDDGYQVTVAFQDRRERLDTYAADDYPVGSRQELLLREDGVVELAAERYDPSGWLAAGLAAALLGLVLGGRSREHLRSVRRLFEGPQPAHAVRLAWAPDGAQVLAVDDDRSLLALELASLGELPDDDQEQPPAQVEAATLYGVPVPGQACAVVLDGAPLLVTTRPARRGDDDWRSQVLDLDLDVDVDVEDGAGPVPAPPAADPAELAAWRARLVRPERWRAPLGLLLIGGSLAGAYLVGRTSDGVLTTLWRCGIAASFAFNGLVHLVSRVHLTPQALVHAGPTTRRTVPWSAVGGVAVVDDDVVLARLRDGDVLPLTWLPHRPRLPGKSRRAAWAGQWAQVLGAEARGAAGGPVQEVGTEARLPGAALALAFTAAVLLGLWARGAL